MNHLRRKIGLVIICLWMGIHPSIAQEENIIATAVYNFTRYIDWPKEEVSTDFYINVIGHKSVYDKLKEMTQGRTVGNRTITVRYLETSKGILPCQILFLGFWQSKDLQEIIDKIGDNHTLIITEKGGLIDLGSGINFVILNNTIKFEIKKSNIVKHGLMVSSDLEKIAYKTY